MRKNCWEMCKGHKGIDATSIMSKKLGLVFLQIEIIFESLETKVQYLNETLREVARTLTNI